MQTFEQPLLRKGVCKSIYNFTQHQILADLQNARIRVRVWMDAVVLGMSFS